MLIGKKVRLQPNNEQEQTFRHFAGANRFLWNESHAFYESAYKNKGIDAGSKTIGISAATGTKVLYTIN